MRILLSLNAQNHHFSRQESWLQKLTKIGKYPIKCCFDAMTAVNT